MRASSLPPSCTTFFAMSNAAMRDEKSDASPDACILLNDREIFVHVQAELRGGDLERRAGLASFVERATAHGVRVVRKVNDVIVVVTEARVVHQIDDRHAPVIAPELGRARPERVVDADFANHLLFLLRAFTAWRMRTRPPFEPGTAPSTRRRFFSGMTLRDLEVQDRELLGAVVAGHLQVRERAARRHVRTDRSAVAAVLVRAVRLHEAGERPATNDAREAAAARRALRVDLLTRLRKSLRA